MGESASSGEAVEVAVNGTRGGSLQFEVSVDDVDELVIKVRQRMDQFGLDDAYMTNWTANVVPENESFGGDIVTWRASVEVLWQRIGGYTYERTEDGVRVKFE